MPSTPKSVVALGLTAFTASTAFIGHSVQHAAVNHHSAAARAAVHAQTYVARTPRSEVAELPARPGTRMEFQRIQGTVHIVDEEEGTVTLDNGFTYTILSNLAAPDLQQGQQVTLAVGTAVDKYTVFMFVDR